MQKFKERAAQIGAVRIKQRWFGGDRLEHPPATAGQAVYIQPRKSRIVIREADGSYMVGRAGDWVVYSGGQYHIVSASTFAAQYEEITDPTPLELLAAEVETLRGRVSLLGRTVSELVDARSEPE